MDALARPIIPPAPYVHPVDLSTPRLVVATLSNTLGNWSRNAFDIPYGRRKVLGVDSLLVNDPAAIREVLQTNMAAYARPLAAVRPVRPLAGAGLLLSEGAAWRGQRRMLAPAFTPGSVESLIPHFHAAAGSLATRLAGEPRANLADAFHQAALEAVLRSLFSLSAGPEQIELAAMVRDYVATAGRPTLFDGFARAESDFAFIGGARRRFQKRWFAAVDRLVAARRAEPPGAGHDDLLDRLLAVRDAETGQPLSDVEVRDQCATMLFAGFETTSRLLFWAAYLLSLDGAEQTRLRQEVRAFPPGRLGTLEDLHRWPRLRQVLLETMRLYPPVPILMRQVVTPHALCGESLGKGCLVWISPWVMHRHTVYWENPTAFIPDRFAGKATPWISEPAYLPFGGGPRICIGASFALAEASIMLATVLNRFEISLESDGPVMPVGGVTTAPDHEPWFRVEAV
ncbi:MAG: cytochrome P450 [Caulobacter sp.]|nr:cytochrome P450 [Caulobacter sp.]